MQENLDIKYLEASDNELKNLISQNREILGDELVILAHHYQRPEIVYLADKIGDSLKLAQFSASLTKARHIVFCGVHFMAESADILKNESQNIYLPNLNAGCDMADMASAEDAISAWDVLVQIFGYDNVIPVTYINSSAELKSFVGEKGGVICTSSNAYNIVKWGLNEKKVLFFLPDEHLGRNTAKKLGILPNQIKLWNREYANGNLLLDNIADTRIILWSGNCPVHMKFDVAHIEKLRKQYENIKIIVHPECRSEVVDIADDAGSTEYLIKLVSQAEKGTVFGIGTEVRLVDRIAYEFPDKKIINLNPLESMCPTMDKIDLAHLAWLLDNILNNTNKNIISVNENIKINARIALNKMLELSTK